MSQAQANTTAAPTSGDIDPRTMFQRKRAITLPVLKMVPGKTRWIGVMGPMHQGKKVDDQKEAATLMRAVDMYTGEEGLFVCPKVLQNELNEAFPGEAYVGRGFEVTYTRVPEKKYNLCSIVEVTVPDHIQAFIDKATKDALATTAGKGGSKGR